jgi:hypothetical protein
MIRAFGELTSQDPACSHFSAVVNYQVAFFSFWHRNMAMCM